MHNKANIVDGVKALNVSLRRWREDSAFVKGSLPLKKLEKLDNSKVQVRLV